MTLRLALALTLLLALAPVAHADDSVHVVQPGETLSQIASDLGVDADALVKLNALDDANILIAGQSLKLPSKQAPSTNYAVADGDTLWGIAQRFNTTTAALVDANHLDDPDHLALGTQLLVPSISAPKPAATPAPAANKPTATAAPAARSLLVPYTVQSGETLNQIAKQFNVRADAIAQASGLDDPNRLSVGAVLKVPLPGHEHVVQSGETLRDIALQEKVDLGSLIDFNNLDDPELIRVGQVVLVPPSTGQAAAAVSQKPTSTPAPAPAPTATPVPAAQIAAAATRAVPTPTAAPAPKPVAPIAVVAPPKDAPTDGLAGAALKFLGAPYVWGGSSPNGFDCSGFIWYVAKQIGRPLSRGMLGEYNSGSHPGRDELKPGDFVFFQNTYSPGLSHNGIYIGNGQFVHAADEAAGVTISSLNTAYWSSHWFGATRLP